MNGDAPMPTETPGPAEVVRSAAVQNLLDEARRALEFDRAHVVLVADGATARALPGLLANSLRGEIEIVTVRLVGGDERVADCVASAVRNARSRVAPPGESTAEPAAPRRARRALVLPDALSIPASSLRRLAEIASRSDTVQRLVLLVDVDAVSVPDPASELVSRLGTGVSKLELESLPRPPSERTIERLPAPPPPSAPPRVGGRRRRRMRPIAIRRRSARGLRTLAWLAAGGLIAGVGLLVTSPALVRYRLPAVSRPAVAPAAIPDDARPTPAPAEPVESDPPPPVGPPRPEADADPDASRPGEPAREETAPNEPAAEASAADAPAAPAPAASEPEPPAPATSAEDEPVPDAPPAVPPILVSVGFNARPWAELQVDGRSIGPTPIGNVRLTPGEHHLVATFPDGRRVERHIRVDALRNRFRIDPP